MLPGLANDDHARVMECRKEHLTVPEKASSLPQFMRTMEIDLRAILLPPSALDLRFIISDMLSGNELGLGSWRALS